MWLSYENWAIGMRLGYPRGISCKKVKKEFLMANRAKTFQSKLNAVTGKVEWVVADKDYGSLDADMTEEFSRYPATHDMW